MPEADVSTINESDGCISFTIDLPSFNIISLQYNITLDCAANSNTVGISDTITPDDTSVTICHNSNVSDGKQLQDSFNCAGAYILMVTLYRLATISHSNCR